MTTPTCFISYSWDSDAHKDWVRSLATALVNGGVETHLDQWDAYPGMDLATFMETCVRESSFVLLICTPTFAQKADASKGGVGYEKAIVTGEIFGGAASPKKFVPILRSGEAIESLPSYLKAKLFLDFRDDARFQANLEQLLRHIYASPMYQRPSLGTRPDFASPLTTAPTPGIVIPPAPTKSLPTTITGKDGRERVLIPAGEFLMGSDERVNEKPPHMVYLDAFYLDRCLVTNADFKRFVDTTKYKSIPEHWNNGQIPPGKENHPVAYVRWSDVVAYATWAGGRLPTEAEWEKAASWDNAKKEKRRYPWGKDFDKNRCNTKESDIGGTTPVDRYPHGASPYGVLDMAGNVWEWCMDLYDRDYYKNAPARNPKGPDSGQYHVARGGSWSNDYVSARCASRPDFIPDFLNYLFGFRVAEPFP